MTDDPEDMQEILDGTYYSVLSIDGELFLNKNGETEVEFIIMELDWRK